MPNEFHLHCPFFPPQSDHWRVRYARVAALTLETAKERYLQHILEKTGYDLDQDDIIEYTPEGEE